MEKQHQQTPPLRTPEALRAAGWSGAFRIAWIVFALSWVARFSFMALPQTMSGEEAGPFLANNSIAAINFFHASSWAERWVMITSRGGEDAPLGFLTNIVVGRLVPSEGDMAVAIQPWAAFIAALALIAAAGRLAGDRGRLMAILLGALSPMLVMYGSRLFMQTQSVMWLALAFSALSNRRGSALLAWGAGGLCAGVALLTAEGLQPVLIALGAGLAVQVLINLVRPGVSLKRRAALSLLGPLVGCVAFLVPYLLVRRWAEYAGRSFTLDPFLLNQWQALRESRPLAAATAGDRLLWLRRAFELEPIWPLALGAFAGAGLLGRGAGWVGRVAFLLIACVIAAALIPSVLAGGVWVLQPLLAGAILGVLGGMIASRGRSVGPTGGEPSFLWRTPSGAAPLGLPAVAVAIAVAGALLWRWPQLASKPRVFFPFWPLGVLGLALPLAAIARGRERRWAWALAVCGMPFLIVGTVVIFRTKNAEFRAAAFELQHPEMKRIRSNPATFMSDGAYMQLRERVEKKVVVVSGGRPWYAGLRYDEDGYDPAVVKEMVHRNGLDGCLDPDELFTASLFYEAKDPTGQALPPPGTHVAPDTKDVLDYKDSQGKRRKPVMHPYRGLALRVSPGAPDQSRAAETVIRFPMQIDAPTSRTFGFEWEAIAPYAPNGIKVHVTMTLEGKGETPREIASFDTPVKVYSPAVTAGAKLVPSNFYHVPVDLVAGDPEVRIKVETIPFKEWLPDDPRDKAPKTSLKHYIPPERRKYIPPLYFYIRRPFIVATEPVPPPVAGVSEVDEAQQIIPLYPSFDGAQRLLARTSGGTGPTNKPLVWYTDPWDGRAETPILFQATQTKNPHCELTIEGRLKIEFQAESRDTEWNGSGASLSSHFLGERGEGSHADYKLLLPPDAGMAGKKLKMELTLLPGTPEDAWFGIRDVKPPAVPKP